jgi:2-polyprenyl-3-methyl-5-hydroxy-6-metoxy-1,4-benzoquinol methylase
MNLTTAIKSPITGTNNVILEKTIDCELIIEAYQNCLAIDVEKYFTDLQHIQLYRCLDTGYRFYYPFNLEGDGKFYEALQVFPWYYVDWKWEFGVVSKLIDAGDRLLEVGSGQGAFIKYLTEQGITATGLELNEQAIQIARRTGLDICRQSIQEHALQKPEYYDVVCSFQVVEHISQIREFLQASIDALKPDGRLIVCVPNNDSFVKHEPVWVTNLPPHHVGLWGKAALQNLENVFPLKLEKIYIEPLTTYDWYYRLQTQRLLAKLENYPLAQKIVRKGAAVLSNPALKILQLFAQFIPGHSVLAVYQKVKTGDRSSSLQGRAIG